jgi:Domain of unknown function (DUF4136)
MKRIISALIFLVVFTSCGTLVHYDYEKSTDFSKYKTYNYFDDMKTGLSQFDSLRLISAMDAKLSAMGLTRADNADFYIDIQSEELMNRSSPNVGVGVGSGGGGVSVGIPIGTNQNTREIIIEFVDKKQNERLFWQAVSESTYRYNASPEKRETTLVKLVEKIFAKYPPNKE